jgi:GntR family transcriptional regulator/MocR family aminotransferase
LVNFIKKKGYTADSLSYFCHCQVKCKKPMNILFAANSNSVEPIFIQLANTIADLIESGKLKAKTRLPSSRELANSLGLSRDTVVNAYRELNRLAYISGATTKGTFVLQREERESLLEQLSSDLNSTKTAIKMDESKLSNLGRQLLTQSFKHPSTPSFAALNYGAIPRSALPIRRWRELMQQICIPETFRKLEYEPNVLGRAELRKAIAAYLFRSKGIDCDWRQVAIFSLSAGIINMLFKLLVEPGSVVAVEDPGYGAVKNIAKSLGIKLLPVPIDDQGLSVSALKQHKGQVKMVYVTPSHHDPTGIIMSPARRKELLAWADENNVWIVEDDYDSTFYYGATPHQTLWSIRPDANVIYSSTFWQILYPLATIGYTVVPKNLIPLLSTAKDLQTEGIADFTVQLTLTKMLDEGHLEKHIRKTQKSFAKKRIALIFELKRQLGSQIDIRNDSAGNYFVVYLQNWSKDTIETAALQANLPLLSTATYYLQEAKAGEYLINFSLLNEEEIGNIVSAFVSALNQV